nr:MAG TPA: CII protein [Caudoviricetes sp.]
MVYAFICIHSINCYLRKYLHMQLTSTRKKANAITSNILNRIAVRGQRKVADALGINESQISRWKDSFIPKMGMLLAVLEWGVEDEELAELAKQVARMLTKEKAPKNGEFFEA